MAGRTSANWETVSRHWGGLEPAVDGCYYPLVEPELSGIEYELGERLPDAYRNFVATYGLARIVRRTTCRSEYYGVFGMEKPRGDFENVQLLTDDFVDFIAR